MALGAPQRAYGLDDAREVLGRRHTAAADHAILRHEFGEVLGQALGSEVVVHLALDDTGQSRVGQARQRHRRGLGQGAQRFVHLDRAGGAVEPQHVDAEGTQRRDGRANFGAGQHAPREFNGHLGLDGHDASVACHGAVTRGDGRLAREQVEHRFDDQQVDAALEETQSHFLVTRREVVVRDLTQGRELGTRTHRARNESRLTGRGVLVGDAAREHGRRVTELEGLVGDAVFGEHHGERPKRIGLDDVDAHVQEGTVQGFHGVGSSEHQQFIATFESAAPEVVGGEFLGLQIRPRRPVVDEHALAQGGQIRVVALGTREGRTKAKCHWLFRLPAYGSESLRLAREDLHAQG